MDIKQTVLHYWDSGKTNLEIQELTGLNKTQVLYGLRENNLKSHRYSELTETDELKQFMLGSMLGDGYLTKIPKNTKQNSKLSIAHKKDHYDYIKFKYDLLNKYELVTKLSYNKIYNSRYKQGYIEEYRFKSKSHPYFTKYRNSFYPEGLKVLPNAIQKLSDFGLAVWYMDDGNVTNVGANIATNSFSSEELAFVQDTLLTNFNLTTTLQKCSGSYKLYISKKVFPYFKEIVNPHIVPIMQYKLIPYKQRVLNKEDELLEPLTRNGDGDQQPSLEYTL